MAALATGMGGYVYGDTVLDDFSSGVTAVNHPEGAGQSGVWYDATNATYGSASASTLDGNPALRVDDGGYGNGVYVIYEGVVPADGEYSIQLDMDVVEAGSPTGFSAYQVGVAVGADAVHRGPNPSALAGLTIIGEYSGLTTGDDTANPTETITTASFTASAGDSILIALGTDVASGSWGGNSSLWSGNYVLVDNIVLKGEDPPPPVEGIVIEDYAAGVTHVNSPGGAGAFEVWYDSTSSTYGTPSASTLDASPAMRIDDGGYGNGVYAIYEAVIPGDGVYQIEADIDVVESAGNPDGIRGYQIGVAVGADAVHRDTVLPGLSITGTYIGLTPNDDTANETQTVVTGEFEAQGGDSILIAFGTDVESGSWGGNSALWSGSYVLVDNIVLRGVEVEPPPFELILDNDDGPAVYDSTGFSTSGSSGYDGGTYQFAGTGAAGAVATWTGTIPEDGYYEVSAIFRAGANRASVATYEIPTAEGAVVGTTDQRVSNLAWAVLGDFQLNAGPITITLNAETSEPFDPGTVVIADAVRIRELPGPPPIDDPEMRIANLLVYDSLDDVGAIQNYVNDIARKRYNAIAVHARYRGDTTYFPNKVDATFPNNEPRNPLVGDVDVLEEVVARGHAAGLKVFAYVNTMLVTEGSDTDPRPEHVLNVHPEWVTYEYNGGNPVPHTTATEIDGIWLDPALPEVRLYNAEICADIVMNYDVDGIMIDRQRYPDTRYNREEADYGYHPDAIAQFNAEYGKSGIPSQFDEDWWQFRRDANTRAMQLIYSTVTALDPDALVLSYPIGRFDDAINYNYQDWTAWLDNKVIDIVIPQIYTSSNAEYSARAAEHINAYDGDRFLGIAIDVFREGTDLEGQVGIARTLGFQGQALFHHTAMGPLGYFELLPDAWPGISAWPETPWKAEEVQCDGLDVLGTDGDDLLVGTACDETIIGGYGSDELIAGAGDDLIVPDPAEGEGTVGDDVIDGGEGVDTVDYSMATRPVIVNLQDGIAQALVPRFLANRFVGTDIIENIEVLIAREGGFDILIGNEEANVIYAAGLNPESTSGFGDWVEGNGGDDVLELGGPNGGSWLSKAFGGEGDDIINGSALTNMLLDGGAGNDVITAYDASFDLLIGGEGDDVLNGGGGNSDYLIGGPGNDTLNGGDGNRDIARFDGRMKDYSLCLSADGQIVVTDLVGDDGVDTLEGIEIIIFKCRSIWVSRLEILPCE